MTVSSSFILRPSSFDPFHLAADVLDRPILNAELDRRRPVEIPPQHFGEDLAEGRFGPGDLLVVDRRLAERGRHGVHGTKEMAIFQDRILATFSHLSAVRQAWPRHAQKRMWAAKKPT